MCDVSISYIHAGGREVFPIPAPTGPSFLLLHGDEPLILDQPEDDLDNHLIYDLIVSQLRDNKRRRQVIVSTYNPNIVVNGDAEMVNAMDQVNGQCVVLEPGSGCLQSRDVRDEICRVMEGGARLSSSSIGGCWRK